MNCYTEATTVSLRGMKNAVEKRSQKVRSNNLYHQEIFITKWEPKERENKSLALSACNRNKHANTLCSFLHTRNALTQHTLHFTEKLCMFHVISRGRLLGVCQADGSTREVI